MKRAGEGFTLIEVMISLAVMTVGALGIMGLQQATTRGNAEAREMTVATDRTRMWIERLRRDALSWTASGAPVAGTTQYLASVGAPGSTPPGWAVLEVDPPVAGESPASDYLGNDVATDSADALFCSQVSLSWVDSGNVIRADVRTWWYRRGTRELTGTLGCDAASVAGVSAALAGPSELRAVYGSTLLRWSRLDVQP